MMGINSKEHQKAFIKIDPAKLNTLNAEQVLRRLQDGFVAVHPMYWIRRYIAGADEDNALVAGCTNVSIGNVFFPRTVPCCPGGRTKPTCRRSSRILFLYFFLPCNTGYGANTAGEVFKQGKGKMHAYVVADPCPLKPCMVANGPRDLWSHWKDGAAGKEGDHDARPPMWQFSDDDQSDGEGNLGGNEDDGDEDDGDEDDGDEDDGDDEATDEDRSKSTGKSKSKGKINANSKSKGKSNTNSNSNSNTNDDSYDDARLNPSKKRKDGHHAPPPPPSPPPGRGGNKTAVNRSETARYHASVSGAAMFWHQAVGAALDGTNLNLYNVPGAESFFSTPRSWIKSTWERFQMYMPFSRHPEGNAEHGRRCMDVAAHVVIHDRDLVMVDWPAIDKNVPVWVEQLESTYKWDPSSMRPIVGRCELGAQVPLTKHDGRFTNEASHQADVNVIADLLHMAKTNKFKAQPLDYELNFMRMVAGALEGACKAAVVLGQTTTGNATAAEIVDAFNELPILLPVLRSWAKSFTNGVGVKTNPYLFCPNTALGSGRPIMLPGAVADHFERVLISRVGTTNMKKYEDALKVCLPGQRYKQYVDGRKRLNRTLNDTATKANLLFPGVRKTFKLIERDNIESTWYCPGCFKPFCKSRRNKDLDQQVRNHACTDSAGATTPDDLINAEHKDVDKYFRKREKRRQKPQKELFNGVVSGQMRKTVVNEMGGVGKSDAINDIVQHMLRTRGFNSVLHVNMTHAAKLQCVTGVTAHSLFRWDYVDKKKFFELIYHPLDDDEDSLKASVIAHINANFSNRDDKRRFMACELVVLGECYQYNIYTMRWIECFLRTIIGNGEYWGGCQVILEGDAPQTNLFTEEEDQDIIDELKRGIPNPNLFFFEDPKFFTSWQFERFSFGKDAPNMRFGKDPKLLKLVRDIQMNNFDNLSVKKGLLQGFGTKIPKYFIMEHCVMVAGAYLMHKEKCTAQQLKVWLQNPTMPKNLVNPKGKHEKPTTLLSQIVAQAVEYLEQGFLEEPKPNATNDDLWHAHIGSAHSQKQALAIITELRYELRDTKNEVDTCVLDNLYNTVVSDGNKTLSKGEVQTLLDYNPTFRDMYNNRMERIVAQEATKLWKNELVLLSRALPNQSLHMWQRMTVEGYDDSEKQELIVTVHHGPNYLDHTGRRLQRMDVDTFSIPRTNNQGKKVGGAKDYRVTVQAFPVIPAMFYTAKATTGLTLPGWVLCCNVLPGLKAGDGYLMITRATTGGKVWFVGNDFDENNVNTWQRWFKVEARAVQYVEKLNFLQDRRNDDMGGQWMSRVPLDKYTEVCRLQDGTYVFRNQLRQAKRLRESVILGI
jgi:hypothetical protein